MSFKESEAIVLKGMKYNDTSKIMTLYSDDFGKFNALVKGVRSIKSNQCGIFEDFNHIKVYFNYKSNRDLQIISKSECINSYQNIKTSLLKLEYAYKILEILNKLNYDFDSNRNLFNLTVKSLTFINENLFDSIIVYLFFLLNFIELSGISIKSKLNNTESLYVRETFKENFSLNDNKDSYKSEILNIFKNGINNIENYVNEISDAKRIQFYLDSYLNDNFDIKNIFGSTLIFKKINEVI